MLLILSQAIRFARNVKLYESIADATYGVVSYHPPKTGNYSNRFKMFFATPHRGADLEFWARVTSNIAGACSPNFRQGLLIGPMRKNSKDLRDVAEDFLPLANDLGIVSFFEEDEVEWLKSVVRGISFSHDQTGANKMFRWWKSSPR